MQDIVQRFIFEDSPIRGEVVSLEQSWQEILQRQDYPAAALLMAPQPKAGYHPTWPWPE